jgi:hypothetical protein
VDWDSLLSRLSYYRAEEKQALDEWENHQCRLDAAVTAAERVA